MGFEPSERATEISARIGAFMDEHIFPREHEYVDSCRPRRRERSAPSPRTSTSHGGSLPGRLAFAHRARGSFAPHRSRRLLCRRRLLRRTPCLRKGRIWRTRWRMTFSRSRRTRAGAWAVAPSR